MTKTLMKMTTTAHLSLDVAHALVVQLGCGAHLEDDPRAHIVVDVVDDREGQQKEADEDPALVDDHVVQAFDSDPEQEEGEQAAQVEQRGHGWLPGRCLCRSATGSNFPLLELKPRSPHRSRLTGRGDSSAPRSLVEAGEGRDRVLKNDAGWSYGAEAGPRGLVPS